MPDDPLIRAVEAHLSDRTRVDELARLALRTLDHLARILNIAREACPPSFVLTQGPDPNADRRRQRRADLEAAMPIIGEIRDQWLALAPPGLEKVAFDYLDTLWIEINRRLPWRDVTPPKVTFCGTTYDTGHRAVFIVANLLYLWWGWSEEQDDAVRRMAHLDALADDDVPGEVRAAITNEQASLLPPVDDERDEGADEDLQISNGAWRVLLHLNSCSLLKTATDLVGELGGRGLKTRGTVGKFLQELLRVRFAERPGSDKKGWRITAAGRDYVARRRALRRR